MSDEMREHYDFTNASPFRDTERVGRLIKLYAELEASHERLRVALESVGSYYSGSLDHQPPYVAFARAALAAIPEVK